MSLQGLLAVDVGTTHCKAALFHEDGRLLKLAKRPTASRKQDGFEVYEPERLWQDIAELIRDAVEGGGVTVAAIGITSMAETGLLVDRASGAAKSPLLPWFSRCAASQAERIEAEGDALERFIASGLRSSFKYGLAKLLWLQDRDPELLRGSVWLSAADFIASRLTGAMATDYTLAARTFAFRIDRKAWDSDWIRHWRLDPALFPEARPAGTPVGKGVSADAARALGLEAGVPVVIAGHDHISAAFAVGAVKPGLILNSMGTAETLVGTLEERALTEQDYASGLSFGLHAVPNALFWMGGASASGGSVEWLRGLLGGEKEPMAYEQVLNLLDQAAHGPTGILYYPYLSGSGAPWTDAAEKASFIGLRAHHGKPELLKAVLEGTAYEMESIRRAANRLNQQEVTQMIAVGGGTHNRHWMQIKADLSGCELIQSEQSEAALQGAAMLAGISAGVYTNAEQAMDTKANGESEERFLPNYSVYDEYIRLYEQGYLPLKTPLKAFYHTKVN